MTHEELYQKLEQLVLHYNRPAYIAQDPIAVPHQFGKRQDIEISGLFAATFAWGQRSTIVRKSQELMALMDGAPHDFVLHHSENDLKRLMAFKHRTFQTTDLLYFVDFLRRHYRQHDSLELAFLPNGRFESVEASLVYFNGYFRSGEYFLPRTGKHVSNPAKNAACKRLNMFLRWMVRKDQGGVDFGLWRRIPMHALVCPCDVHVLRVAYGLSLLNEQETKSTWKTALLLTQRLRQFCPEDPVRYDFALFNLGIEKKA